jgi:hypothetical protein
MKHHFLTSKIAGYEKDPELQIKFHLKMMRFWAINTPVLAGFWIFSLIVPHDAIAIDGGIILYTALISLYANWDTDYGAVSGAIAARQTQPTNKEISQQIKDLPLNETP